MMHTQNVFLCKKSNIYAFSLYLKMLKNHLRSECVMYNNQYTQFYF